jgi:outer membrane protein assembly factor BamB
MAHNTRPILLLLVVSFGNTATLTAEDWPEWRGKGRQGVWTETGIVDKFPADGLKVSWRGEVGNGYAGPAVADGRVYVSDIINRQGRRGTERALCLDENSGKVLWRHEWPADYSGMSYDNGPRATPTVDGDRVYILGAAGALHCLNAKTGKVIWKKDYGEDYNTEIPTWGIAGAPLVDGDRLIALVGGEPDAKVVAFDKMTGKELWRALSSDGEPGYNPPFLVEVGGTKQLIIWHPHAITSLGPETGEVFWEHAFDVHHGLTVATPVVDRNRLLVTAFYEGSRMLKLSPNRPRADLVWKGNSNSEIETDGLHSLVSTPVIQGDYVYGIGSYGQLRCLDARTGKRVWETMDATIENARWATGHLVRQGDRFFISNDRGELIIAKLSPEGYEEIDRTKIIEPTSSVNRRRELGAINWTHPAYANRHLIIRNDKEIVRYSLARE